MRHPVAVSYLVVFSHSFFFQAEDGIRDHCVTGVQTCALPIFANGGVTHNAIAGACRHPRVLDGLVVFDDGQHLKTTSVPPGGAPTTIGNGMNVRIARDAANVTWLAWTGTNGLAVGTYGAGSIAEVPLAMPVASPSAYEL